MNKIILNVLIGFLIFIGASNVLAAENEFKKNNPDGNKYEFARSYISALSYFRTIENRWSQNPPKKKFPKDELKMIRGNIEYYVLDNANLRIIKGYLNKYLTSSNQLMRKVSDLVIIACDKEIVLNDKAKDLWQNWLEYKTKAKPKVAEEKEFSNSLRQLELQRKEIDKSVIKASALMTKVLLSQDNANDKGKLLAITEKQRSKLLEDLEVYGKDVTDWGVKPGQSTLDASIAIIREVLEDPIFKAHK